MARKNTARCTPLKETPMKIYEIGYDVEGTIFKDHVEASSVVIDGDDLIIYQHIQGLDEQIGGFKNWCFFRQIKTDSFV